MKKKILAGLAMGLVAIGMTGMAQATSWTYSDEATYLAKISELGYGTIFEGFEDDGTWGGTRITNLGTTGGASSVTSQGLTWSTASSLGIGTHANYGFNSSTWGIFDVDKAGAPDEVYAVTSSQALGAVGGWFKPWTASAISINLLDGTVENFSTSVVNGWNFFGVIETNGFDSFNLTSNGEWGADAFTIANLPILKDIGNDGYAPVPEPATMLLFGIGIAGFAGSRIRRQKTAA